MSDEPIGDVVLSSLTQTQAYALAELCKRIGWTECRSNATNDAEARNMIAAMERVRGALAVAGVSVR